MMCETPQPTPVAADPTHETPHLARVSVHVVQERGEDGTYLLCTGSGRYLKMAPSAYHLLAHRNRGASFEAIAEAMSRRQGGDEVLPEEVEQAHASIMARLRKIEATDSLTRSGFWFRLPLITEAMVNRLAPLFAVFFRPGAAAALLGLIVGRCLGLSPPLRLLSPSTARA